MLKIKRIFVFLFVLAIAVVSLAMTVGAEAQDHRFYTITDEDFSDTARITTSNGAAGNMEYSFDKGNLLYADAIRTPPSWKLNISGGGKAEQGWMIPIRKKNRFRLFSMESCGMKRSIPSTVFGSGATA